MTSVAAARRPDRADRAEWMSFVGVLVVTAIAVVAGLAFLRLTDEQGRRVDQGGVSADVPTGWVVAEPVGDLLFSAYDPMDPDHRYVVAAGPANGGSPEDIARARLTDRRSLLPGLTVLEDGPAMIDAVPTHRLRYTFSASFGGQGSLIEAREDYVADGDRVLVVGLESPRDTFAISETSFAAFASQVVAGRTTAIQPTTTAAAVRLAGLVASARGAGATGPVAPAATGGVVSSTVQIFGLRVADDPTSAFGWGSGTIITADGLILTNAHVAMPSAGGLGVQGMDPTPAVDPAGLVVALVEDEAEPAVPRYFATVIAADGYLDAAIIRIDRAIDGTVVAPGSLDLPVLPLGDSDALRVGDDLTVVGYPGIGGNTISLSSGEVSGFLGDPRIGARAWIKTDAVVSQGNSGGLAANSAGEIVGLPTMANPDDTGGYSLIRPISLIRPMVDDALAGTPSLDSRYTVPGTGQERMAFQTWTATVTECVASPELSSYPSGTREVTALFEHFGLADGEDLVSQWSIDGQIVYRSLFQFGVGASAGGCFAGSLYSDRGLPDGAYRVELFIGPGLRAVASAATAVGVGTGSAGSASLSGRVIDVDSRQPVAGAVVFFLRPGTNPDTWLTTPNSEGIAGSAETGPDGRFTIAGLTPGTIYPGVVVADGYVPVTGAVGPVGEGAGTLDGDVPLLRAGP